MFTIKWIDSDGFEHLYQGSEPRFRSRNDERRTPDGGKDTRAIFSYLDENKAACSMDKGTVYVMNENGKTVATYHLTLLNSDAFPEPRMVYVQGPQGTARIGGPAKKARAA